MTFAASPRLLCQPEGGCRKPHPDRARGVELDGEYHYQKCGASHLKYVGEMTRKIKSKESAVNLLFISSGTSVTRKRKLLPQGPRQTPMHWAHALLADTLRRKLASTAKQAMSPRPVAIVFASTKDRRIYPSHFQANKLGITLVRGHRASMVTFRLVAVENALVSFIHDYTGFVKTDLSPALKGPAAAMSRLVFKPLLALLHIHIDEVGERHVSLATSARFPPEVAEPKAAGVPLAADLEVAFNTEARLAVASIRSVTRRRAQISTYERPFLREEKTEQLKNPGSMQKKPDHSSNVAE
ncbi:hypothetical protein DL764_002957 [Monosporascus ibericus]|uniref:Uncharacterized protein n=1 Tax=Monosporascus ibericus TaxID=155417 RepID=A0A4Q4TMH1_9PEZI|nr:hypothetical protein DL764_002957 [Monosporascus ibericus]